MPTIQQSAQMTLRFRLGNSFSDLALIQVVDFGKLRGIEELWLIERPATGTEPFGGLGDLDHRLGRLLP